MISTMELFFSILYKSQMLLTHILQGLSSIIKYKIDFKTTYKESYHSEQTSQD
jgi:hypothetical protein